MKIVWVNRSEWKKPGPIVYIGLLNALSFAELGYETHFFVSEGPSSTTLDDLVDFYGTPPCEQLHIHRVPKGGKISEIPGRKIYRQAIAFTRKELLAGETILFLTRELGLTGLMAQLQRRFSTSLRTIYEAHDFHADLSARDHKTNFNDHRKKWVERLFLPRLSGVLCIAPPQEELFRAALPNLNILTQALGCLKFPAPTEQKTEERRRRRTVVYVGHLHRYKGVHDLVDQADFFRQHKLKLHLVGGKPKQTERFRKQLRQPDSGDIAPDEPGVHFFPSMPPVQLHQHLEKYASAGIVPLQDSHYNRALTCPVKALDSLSHHLPVIASDLPTTRAVLGGAGIYLPPDQPGQFPQAIQQLIDDPQQYRQRTLNAGNRALELSWKNRAQTILNWR